MGAGVGRQPRQSIVAASRGEDLQSRDVPEDRFSRYFAATTSMDARLLAEGAFRGLLIRARSARGQTSNSGGKVVKTRGPYLLLTDNTVRSLNNAAANWADTGRSHRSGCHSGRRRPTVRAADRRRRSPGLCLDRCHTDRMPLSHRSGLKQVPEAGLRECAP